MHSETVEYRSGEITMHGHLVHNGSKESPKPAIIVAHAWRGQDDFAREKAKFLAQMGYVGFAADLYGEGKCVDTDEDAFNMMSPLFVNRMELRSRIVAAFKALSAMEVVDSTRIGAIGFCFGGLTVIELLRSGVDIRGVVSFHGLLGNKLGETVAETIPNDGKLKGSILLLHGHLDPLVSQQDINAIKYELTEARVDWQMNIYGEASHAFTNPQANDQHSGLIYNQKTEKRAIAAMENFFKEVLL